jgi:hypothetical protein
MLCHKLLQARIINVESKLEEESQVRRSLEKSREQTKRELDVVIEEHIKTAANTYLKVNLVL